eukprot:CAMPEP_0194228950 /NCGR_PEP_ID=MMETSP0156-20130528/43638_1 /TAXON_ID=33649 /ORGANISM="Thalassionema nitzschioides, Strain L26-B" /LENGTH=98 /DNA_ID=CAMNT_0038961479 /DNA_START=625 /DNA_END=921 /DNA_ORIENTATION=-
MVTTVHQDDTKEWPPGGEYIADIGFSVRRDATGGGGVLSSQAMKFMRELGMDVWFSEYDYSDSTNSNTKRNAKSKEHSRKKKGERSALLKMREKDARP